MTKFLYARISFALPSAENYTDGMFAHPYEAALEWQQTMEYQLGFLARVLPLDENHPFPLAYVPQVD